MRTTKRRTGVSPHCQTEGPHGLHWVPSGMWGDMMMSDLCTGPPKALVLKAGKRREVTDLEYSPNLGLWKFRYVDTHVVDYTEHDLITIAID